MTERERQAAGELYDPSDAELTAARAEARRLTRLFNDSADPQALRSLLGSLGDGAWIEPPFRCDYGTNIALGERAFLNFDCVILDCARVEIAALTQIGPKVQLCAVTHPLEPEERATLLERALPIVIGENVWIGAGAIVGAGAVIGAGSVVLRDVPPRVLAAGSPARVLRPL